jgi:MFS family permease
MGGILAGDLFREMLGYPNPTMEGLLSAIYCFGCACGAGVSFVFGDRMGRVGTIFWANLISKQLGRIMLCVLTPSTSCRRSRHSDSLFRLLADVGFTYHCRNWYRHIHDGCPDLAG